MKSADVFEVNDDDDAIICGGRAGGPYVPGIIDKKSGGFIPSSKLIALYKKQLKAARGKKAHQLKKALSKAQKYYKKAAKVCKRGRPTDDDDSNPTPVPDQTPGGSVPTVAPTATPGGPVATAVPTAVPTIAPTATPSIPSGNNCDAQRRTTGFGIPAGLIGNGQTGRTLWTASCASCHGASGKLGKSYAAIYGSRTVGIMSGVSALLGNTQNAADITADRNCP